MVGKINSMRSFLSVVALISFHIIIFSQSEQVDSIKYSSGFKFIEGLYVNFQQVRFNNPIPKSRIISTEDYTESDFFDKILEKNKIYYYDNVGNKNELLTDKIWGYSRNGVLFIKMLDDYYRITQIGSICHFVAVQTTYSNMYPSAYYYNPYMDPYMNEQTYSNSEMRQFLLDFATGKIYDYSTEGMEILLMGDPVLHDEFMLLKKKKKKQSLFLYLRKYNERNPLYFPKIKT
jgi:hypothetical protein